MRIFLSARIKRSDLCSAPITALSYEGWPEQFLLFTQQLTTTAAVGAVLLASHRGDQRSAGCTLSYGDERGDRGMFSCLSELPHLLLLLPFLLLRHHHRSPLILMLTHSQALSRHFETPQTNSPVGGVRRGREGLVADWLMMKVSRTLLWCNANSLRRLSSPSVADLLR